MDRRLIAAALALAIGAGAARGQGPSARAAQPRAASVELRLPPGDDAAAVGQLVAIARGDRLSVAAARLTVQRLFQTGRYRNVIVRAADAKAPDGEAGEWVRVVVEALPVRVIQSVQVRIEGPCPLDADAIRAAGRLSPGGRFDDGDLAPAEARVRAALARRGHPAAGVSASANGERAPVVEFTVRAGEPVRVAAVRLTGDPGPSAAAFRAALRTREGAVLDGEVLDGDVRALRASLEAAGHRRARVSAPVVRIDGSRAEVEIPVEAGPRIAFVFRGNEQIPAEALARQLGFEEGQPVDFPAVASAADRLLAFYRARGYAAARVEPEEVPRGRDLAVVFHVDEGRPYRVESVRIEGASFRTERWLRERLRALLDEEAPDPDDAAADAARALAISVPGAPVPPTAPAALAPHETWDEEAWSSAAERIVDTYRADGFLEALYLGSSVTLDSTTRTADVTLRLREGERTIVESISFEGNEEARIGELARLARLAPGDPLAFDRVEETRAAILRLYLSRGHLYARVEAREDIDRERRLALVRFAVSEGPRVRIGRILVTGNRRTREDLVRRSLSLAEGQVYDPEAVSRSQAALLRLGVFRSVGLRIQEPEVPQETKDVAVELAERPWASLSQGVGFSLANGPRAFVEWGQPNLLGRALELSARSKVNYPLDEFRPDLAGKSPKNRIEGRADLGLRTPLLEVAPFPASGRAALVGEMLHRRAYDLRRATAVTGVDVGLTSRSSFSLQYEVEVDRIAKTEAAGFLTELDLERLRFDEGVTTLHALRPSLTFDHRDNSAHPSHGWFATASLEWAHSLGGPSTTVLGLLPGSDIHTNLLKVAATASTYLPVGGATVLALSLRGGRVFPQDGRSRTIVPRRFFMGGATTMRGYGEEEMIQEDVRTSLADEARACARSFSDPGCTKSGQLILQGKRPVSEGGEAFLLAKAELRIRLRGSLEAGLFADLGNLWLDPDRLRVLDLRPNVGFGIRFVTPIGPAVLDIGFNPLADRSLNEQVVAPHFTIGLF